MKTKWISVKDRLPEYGKTVIVGGINSDVVPGFLMGDEIDGKTGWAFLCYAARLIDNHVTHWQPFPDPPEE